MMNNKLTTAVMVLTSSLVALSCLSTTGCSQQDARTTLTSQAALEERVLAYETEPGYEAAFGQPNSLSNPQQTLLVSQQGIIDAQTQQLRKVEVVTSAQVLRLLPTDENGLRHQKFLIGLNNGTTVLVANDLTMGQMVPLNPGDVVEIKGEYIWTRRGGVLHWTHHTDDAHPGGWIRLGNITYQ